MKARVNLTLYSQHNLLKGKVFTNLIWRSVSDHVSGGNLVGIQVSK